MSATPRTVFLLSPANCAGKRAGYLLRKDGPSALAQRLRSEGATIGEVFTFMSGLYFRGKLAYALAFADPPADCPGTQVIVPGMGLLAHDTVIRVADLRAIARIPVDPEDRRYVGPLQRDAARVADQLAPGDTVVLLGSIATSKYLEPLTAVLGERLRYPREFVGLGDMSRGSMMLKCVAAARPLTYVSETLPAPR